MCQENGTTSSSVFITKWSWIVVRDRARMIEYIIDPSEQWVSNDGELDSLAGDMQVDLGSLAWKTS